MFFESLGVCASVVTIGEIGDKTQLLALLLAARFRAPLPIILGIFAATVLNHSMAGFVGNLLAGFITPEILRWVLIVSFLAMAVWMLIPDEADEEGLGNVKKFGAFGTTLVLFFLAEMGDKTQVATIALAANYAENLFAVVCGTTLGMMIADVPAVFAGEWIMKRVSLKVVRITSCVIFLGLALAAFLS